MNDNKQIDDPRTSGIIGLKGLKPLETTKKEVDSYKQVFNSEPVIVDPQYYKAKRAYDEATKQDFSYVGGQEGLDESKYDKDISSYSQLFDLNESRAQIQSGIAQFGAGLVKMAGLAGTTFLNNTIGIIAGLGSLAQGKGYWDNEFNKAMESFNQGMEEVLPNYYTNAEREAPWYTKLGTANFWADGVLKNVGYVLGSVYSGGLIGKGLTSILGASAKGTAAWMKSLDSAAKLGEGTVKSTRTARDITKGVVGAINKGVTTYGAPTKFILNTVAMSAGESAMEGLRAANDFVDTNSQYVLQTYEQDLSSLDMEFLTEAEKIMTSKGDYTIIEVDGKPTKVSKDEAMKLAEAKHRTSRTLLEQTRDSRLGEVQRLSKSVGNTTMTSNLALLSLTNATQFKRLLRGGYDNAFSGKALKVLNKETGEAIQGTNAIAKGLVEGTAQVAANKGVAGKAILGSLKNFASEGFEEGAQSVISNASQIAKSAELNTFAGAKLNPYVSSEVDGLISAGVQAVSEQFGSIDSPGWEEVAIGGIMGLMGVPMVKRKATDKGKSKLSVDWQGGIKEAIGEAKEEFKSNEVVDKINQRLQDPRFISLYQGAVRHGNYEKIMDKAVEENNEFVYSTAEGKQLLSDILTFQEAGLIDSFYEMNKGFGTITKEGVEELRKESIDENGYSIYDGKSDEEIITEVAERAKKVEKNAKSAIQMHKFHQAMLGEEYSKNAVEELTFMNFMAKEFDDRSNDYAKKFSEKVIPLLSRAGIETISLPSIDKTTKVETIEEFNIEELSKINPRTLIQAVFSNEKFTSPNGEEVVLGEYLQQLMAKGLNSDEIQEQTKTLNDLKSKEKKSKKDKAEISRLKQVLKLLIGGKETFNATELKEVLELGSNSALAFASANKFLNDYNEALINPKSLNNRLTADEVKAQEETSIKIAKEEIDALNSATTMAEMKEAAKQIPENRRLDTLRGLNVENSTPETINKAQNLVELYKLHKGLEGIMDSKIDTKKYPQDVIDKAYKTIDKILGPDIVDPADAMQYLGEVSNKALDETISIYNDRMKTVSNANNNNSATPVPKEQVDTPPTADDIAGAIEIGVIDDNGVLVNTDKSSENTPIDSPKQEVLTQNKELQEEEKANGKMNSETLMSNTTEAVISTNNRPGVSEGIYTPLPELDSKYAESYQYLKASGAFEYMNSGKLGEKFMQAMANDTFVPIYFLRDKAFVNANTEYRSDLVYMVVEDSNGPIKANGKKYQIVGDLKTTLLYTGETREKNPVAMNIVDRVVKAAEASADNLVIPEDVYLALEDITSGRLIMQAKEVPMTNNGYRTLTMEEFNGVVPKIGYVKNREFDAPHSDKFIHIPNGVREGNLEGSTYILAPAPNGNYIPLYVTPKLYNDTEYPIDSTKPNKLNEAIRKVAENMLSEKFEGENKVEGKYGTELMKWLYFGQSNEGYPIKALLFKNEDGSITLELKGRSFDDTFSKDENLGALLLFNGTEQVQTPEDIIEFLRRFNPRIQVSIAALKGDRYKEYIETLISSGALYTNLAFMHTVNSSPILRVPSVSTPTKKVVPTPIPAIEESGITREVATLINEPNNPNSINGNIKIQYTNDFITSVSIDDRIITDEDLIKKIKANIAITNKEENRKFVGKSKTLYQINDAQDLFYGALVDNQSGKMSILPIKEYRELEKAYKEKINTKKLESLSDKEEDEIPVTFLHKATPEQKEAHFNMINEQREKQPDSLGIKGVKNTSKNLEMSEKFPIFASTGKASSKEAKDQIRKALKAKGFEVKGFSNESLGNAVLEALIAKKVVSSLEEFNTRYTTPEAIEQVINCKL